MTQQLAQQIGQNGPRRVTKPTYGYYRRNDGWVTVSPATSMDELNYRRDGWEPLTRYGYLEMSSEWAADHPFEYLFMLGGAKELPVDQVLEMGFAFNPPTVPGCRISIGPGHNRHNKDCWDMGETVIFPQLSNVPAARLGPFGCHFCERELPTVKAQQQHEKVAHGPEKSDVRTGEALASALVEGLKGQSQGGGNDAVVAELLGQMAAMREELASLKARK